MTYGCCFQRIAIKNLWQSQTVTSASKLLALFTAPSTVVGVSGAVAFEVNSLECFYCKRKKGVIF